MKPDVVPFKETDKPTWWFDRWKSPFTALFAIATIICGIVTLVSFSYKCWAAGLLQVICGLVVLMVEAPMFVSCCKCASPIGMFLERQHVVLRGIIYLLLAIIPCFINCWGVFFILGFMSSLVTVLIYMIAYMGPKAPRADMIVASQA